MEKDNEVMEANQLPNRLCICKSCGTVLTNKIDKPKGIPIIVKIVCQKCLDKHKD